MSFADRVCSIDIDITIYLSMVCSCCAQVEVNKVQVDSDKSL